MHLSVSKQKKKQQQTPDRKWVPHWIAIEGFQNWVVLDAADDYNVRCGVCNDGKKLGCKKSTLINHALSLKHSNACKAKNIPVIRDFSLPADNEWSRKLGEAKLKYSAMYALFNLAFRISNLMVKVLSSIDSSSIFSHMKVGATKVRDLVVNVISRAIKMVVAAVLRENYFCINLDESTDCSKDKILVITDRYTDPVSRKVCSRMWDMPRVFKKGEEASCGAERICEVVTESFGKFHITITNIFACCSDACPTMVGSSTG